MLVRFTAASLVGLGVLEVGLYVADCLAHHQPIGILHGLLLFLPFILGVVVFIRARVVAEWFEDKFD